MIRGPVIFFLFIWCGNMPGQRIQDSIGRVEEVVITGTKTAKRKTESPVLVNVISNKTLNQLNTCNVADGARFQPGLRVESNCQTCNYTQLRINGLMGGYSQVLINGRPIFSPITGLYGLEQIPTEQISRMEVIRGGGSSLYGSSAIGGTVNILLKDPNKKGVDVTNRTQVIGSNAFDHSTNIGAQWVPENKNWGVGLTGNIRQRDYYDANGDQFSELPRLEQYAIGLSSFWKPSDKSRINLNVSTLNEYRHGGDMLFIPAEVSRQSEERYQDVWMATLDYRYAICPEKSMISIYSASQITNRSHFTGVRPDSLSELIRYLDPLPRGNSLVRSSQVGTQWDLKNTGQLGTHTLTLGTEFLWEDVHDEIKAYRYLIDQTSRNWGVFVQSDWTIKPSWILLTGTRLDIHNFMSKPRLSPRVALLHRYNKNSQFRLSYGAGFRAPQAFDTDMHIAFAGGGISRVGLANNLLPEISSSWGLSWNYDKPLTNVIYGFTLDLFHTKLDRAFYLRSVGKDMFGERFLKVNGQGAFVQGITVESRLNLYGKVQWEAGFTAQRSLYVNPVIWMDAVKPMRSFIRTPNLYGFARLNWSVTKNSTFDLNYIYTGPMWIPHFAGAPEQTEDEIVRSNSFHEIGCSIRRNIPTRTVGLFGITLGVKNALNSYQRDFDSGKNRDSNYVYGPIQPRSVFFSINWKWN